MRLTGVDPYKLMVWAREAYDASSAGVPGGTVELHVWPDGWGLRVEGADDVEDFVMEPDGRTR